FDDVSERFVKRDGVQTRTNKQSEAGSLCLCHRAVNHRQRRHFVDRVKAHPRHHADNLRHNITFFVIASVNRETFADWILAREKLFRHCLIDDDDARRIFYISFVESASAQKWELKFHEIIAGDYFEVGRGHVTGRRRRRNFAPESRLPSDHQRRNRSYYRALTAMKR